MLGWGRECLPTCRTELIPSTGVTQPPKPGCTLCLGEAMGSCLGLPALCQARWGLEG